MQLLTPAASVPPVSLFPLLELGEEGGAQKIHWKPPQASEVAQVQDATMHVLQLAQLNPPAVYLLVWPDTHHQSPLQ